MAGARRYHVQERCMSRMTDSGEQCEREARYTSTSGDRLCGLCAAGGAAVRDGDVPQLVNLSTLLLTILDQQGVVAASSIRDKIRELTWVKKL